jgi:hypothetical protein
VERPLSSQLVAPKGEVPLPIVMFWAHRYWFQPSMLLPTSRDCWGGSLPHLWSRRHRTPESSVTAGCQYTGFPRKVLPGKPGWRQPRRPWCSNPGRQLIFQISNLSSRAPAKTLCNPKTVGSTQRQRLPAQSGP